MGRDTTRAEACQEVDTSKSTLPPLTGLVAQEGYVSIIPVLGGDENILELNSGGVIQLFECTKTTLFVYF